MELILLLPINFQPEIRDYSNSRGLLNDIQIQTTIWFSLLIFFFSYFIPSPFNYQPIQIVYLLFRNHMILSGGAGFMHHDIKCWSFFWTCERIWKNEWKHKVPLPPAVLCSWECLHTGNLGFSGTFLKNKSDSHTPMQSEWNFRFRMKA